MTSLIIHIIFWWFLLVKLFYIKSVFILLLLRIQMIKFISIALAVLVSTSSVRYSHSLQYCLHIMQYCHILQYCQIMRYYNVLQFFSSAERLAPCIWIPIIENRTIIFIFRGKFMFNCSECEIMRGIGSLRIGIQK